METQQTPEHGNGKVAAVLLFTLWYLFYLPFLFLIFQTKRFLFIELPRYFCYSSGRCRFSAHFSGGGNKL